MTGIGGISAIGPGLALRRAGRDAAGPAAGRPEEVSPATAVSFAVLTMALGLAVLVAWRLLVDPQAMADDLIAGNGSWVALVRGLVGR